MLRVDHGGDPTSGYFRCAPEAGRHFRSLPPRVMAEMGYERRFSLAAMRVADVPFASLCAAAKALLLDHLVSDRYDRRWKVEPKYLRRPRIDSKNKSGWLLDRKVGRFCTLDDLVHVVGGIFEHGRN